MKKVCFLVSDEVGDEVLKGIKDGYGMVHTDVPDGPYFWVATGEEFYGRIGIVTVSDFPRNLVTVEDV